MLSPDEELIARLAQDLARQNYNPVAAGNYCIYARGFLQYLALRKLDVAAVRPPQVEEYLRHAIRSFRKRHGRPPASRWHAIPRSESTRCCASPKANGRLNRK